MILEIILPTGKRLQYQPRSNVKAGNLAVQLARKHGLSRAKAKKGPKWYFRGPLGEIPPGAQMRHIELMTGECLKLEEHQ